MKRSIFIIILIIFQIMILNLFDKKYIFAEEIEDNMKKNIIDEAKEIKKYNRKAKIDITYLIDKYVDINENRKYIEDFLNNSEFRVYSVPETNTDNIFIVGTYDIKDIELMPIIGHNEIRLIFTFKEDKIIEYKGYIFYHGL